MVETEVDYKPQDTKEPETNTDFSSLPLAVEDEEDEEEIPEKREYKEIFVKNFSEAVNSILKRLILVCLRRKLEIEISA